MKLFHNNHVYEITNPKVQLWSLKEIDRVSTWPKLPIGVRGKLIVVKVEEVKPFEGYADKRYLVYRHTNHRIVKFSRRFYG